MILAGFALWLCGVLVGLSFTGYGLLVWIWKNPERAAHVLSGFIIALARLKGNAAIKLRCTLLQLGKGTLVDVYCSPDELCAGIENYARDAAPFTLSVNTNHRKASKYGAGPSQEAMGSEAEEV